MGEPIYKRIVLKLSGEALQGSKPHGIDQDTLITVAKQVKEIRAMGLDVAIVLGGGNCSSIDVEGKGLPGTTPNCANAQDPRSTTKINHDITMLAIVFDGKQAHFRCGMSACAECHAGFKDNHLAVVIGFVDPGW